MKSIIKKIYLMYYNKKYSSYIYTTKIPVRILFDKFRKNMGKEVLLNKDVRIIGNIKIGDYSYINGGYLYCGKIGKFCSMGFNINIGPGEHFTEKVSTYPLKNRLCKIPDSTEFKEINEPVIGNDVWIGNGVTILQGVNIGDGAIIGSGAVVTKDVEPYSIVGGVPAKKIRSRFSNEQIYYLKKIKWWDWEYDKIKNSLLNGEFDNIDEFILKYK